MFFRVLLVGFGLFEPGAARAPVLKSIIGTYYYKLALLKSNIIVLNK